MRQRVSDVAAAIKQPSLLGLLRRFLFDQLNHESQLSSSDLPLSACLQFSGQISVFYSATASFYAPSDPSGIHGMRREHIRATPSWQSGVARRDCIFVNSNPDLDGMRGLDVARVLLFFSCRFYDIVYPCALVHWFRRMGDEPDEVTGMWIVQPEVSNGGKPTLAVVHLDCIIRTAHLIGKCGSRFIPQVHCNQSMDLFQSFYVNKFADHHAFSIAY